jgi:hypothetical protein
MMRQLLRPFAMFGAPLSRRAIFGRLVRIGLLASAVRSLPALAATSDTELRALAELVRKLVPHAGLDQAVYLDAATTIRGTLAPTAQEVDGALQRLGALADGELPASDVLLTRMRTAAVEAVYRDPRVFELIGYGGNALAKGGYLRTFNNMDWLPGEKE